MSQGTQRLQLKIGGMACSFCAASITRGLGRMPGVRDASVSLAHEEVLVEYDPDAVSEERLRTTLLDLGYTIRDPRRVKAYEEQQKEIDVERRRLATAAVLTGLALLQMALMWFRLVPKPSLSPVMAVAMPAIALTTVFGPGLYILRMAWHSLKRKILNQHVLLEFGAFSGLLGGALGLVGAYGHVPQLSFPAPDFFAVATFITTYHILSGYASLLVRARASRSVMKLLDLQPRTAHVVRDGVEREVPVEEVGAGERVRIRPGDSIPLDGRVVEGSSGVNESLVTGESLPVDKAAGSDVIGGSVNLTGALVIEVTRVGEDSFLNQVARQIEEARARKPGILQLVDRVLAIYVPAVLVAAGAAILMWTLGAYLVTGHVDISRAILAMLAVFVMGYPCALGMATPLAMIRGGGMAAEHGILIRGGDAFQVLKDISRIALDKTGTLTEGRPSVTKVIALGGASGKDVLEAAVSAEAPSEHPLARAIVEKAGEEGITARPLGEFEAIPGKGVRARFEGETFLVGSPRFAREHGVDLATIAPQVEAFQAEGNTVVVVVRGRAPIGVVAIADRVKSDAREAVAELKAVGIEPTMITGDNARTAKAVAAAVGIHDVRAEVLPDEKALAIRELQKDGSRVMMVGDGINDAPALTQADVGVAIGAGTDIAIESADVVLMGEHLLAVTRALDIGRNSYRKTVQNISLAFIFNGIGIPLAATGLLAPSWAMLAMVASVSTVLANSFLGGRRLEASRLMRPPYPAPSKVTLKVPSMHCDDCLKQVTEALRHTEGVISVEGQLDEKAVTVRYDETATGLADLESSVRETGHTVSGRTKVGRHAASD